MASERVLAEKLAAAERRIAKLRLLVVAANTVLYLAGGVGAGVPWLAYTMLGVSWAYGLWVVVAAPYRRHQFLLSSYFISATDGTFIFFWLLATGGWDSPFYVLLYLTGLTVALRYPTREAILGAIFYAGSYVALAALTGGLAEGPHTVAVRVVYIFLATALGDVASREIVTQATAKQLLAQELEIAQRIQSSLLPSRPSGDGLEIAARMATATEVGGDYYDVVPTRDGFWVAIGDVVGHGLNAGLVMLMAQSAASALLRGADGKSAREVVVALNRVLHDNLRRRMKSEDFMTLLLCRYHHDGRLVYAGAHEEILVCRAESGPGRAPSDPRHLARRDGRHRASHGRLHDRALRRRRRRALHRRPPGESERGRRDVRNGAALARV
jgi:hypothetical protein